MTNEQIPMTNVASECSLVVGHLFSFSVLSVHSVANSSPQHSDTQSDQPAPPRQILSAATGKHHTGRGFVASNNLLHLTAQKLEIEAYKHIPWDQFLDLTYGSLTDDPIERNQPLTPDVRDEIE